MKKIILIALMLSTSVFSLWAIDSDMTDAHIIGHTVEKSTNEHIPYVTISLLNTNFGTITDATGHFFLKNLPEGDYVIEARAIGYVPQTQKVTVRKNRQVEVNFALLEDALQIDQVVVTGSKSEVKRRNSSSLVNVVGKQTFELVNASCLADGLNFQPGVRVENDCQNCGFTQVRINGLDGHYSQILMNSRPVFSDWNKSRQI